MVDAKELWVMTEADDSSMMKRAGVFFCNKDTGKTEAGAPKRCGRVWKDEESAEDCCKPYEELHPKTACVECGALEQYAYQGKWCNYCADVQKVFEGKLKLIPLDQIPDHPYCLNYDEEYFDCLEDFFEWFEDTEEPGSRPPKYLYVTKEMHLKLDAGDIVDNALSDAYEDAYDNVGRQHLKELQDFLDKWCKEAGIKWYEARNVVVEIPWEQTINNIARGVSLG